MTFLNFVLVALRQLCVDAPISDLPFSFPLINFTFPHCDESRQVIAISNSTVSFCPALAFVETRQRALHLLAIWGKDRKRSAMAAATWHGCEGVYSVAFGGRRCKFHSRRRERQDGGRCVRRFYAVRNDVPRNDAPGETCVPSCIGKTATLYA